MSQDPDRLFDCLHRVDPRDPALPYPRVQIRDEEFVSLRHIAQDIEPFIAHVASRSRRLASGDRDALFPYCLRLSDPIASWRSLDPQDGIHPANEWQTLVNLLAACGVRLFDRSPGNEPRPDAFGPERFDLRLQFTPSGPSGPALAVTRRAFVGGTTRQRQLFGLLAKRRRPLEAIPAALVEQALEELRGFVREDTVEFPLPRLIGHIREGLEEAVIVHHYLYGRTIDAVREACGSSLYHPQEILTYHLVSTTISTLDRSGLIERVRQRFPGFVEHPLLKDQVLAQPAKGTTAPVVAEEEIKPEVWLAIGLSAGPGDWLRMRFRAPDVGLRSILEYLDAELEILHIEALGVWKASWANELDAARLAYRLPMLSGSWESVPSASEVDYDDFWRKQVWNVSADGRSRSSISMTSLRYALYSPPYGGASELEQEILEPLLLERIFGTGFAPADLRVFAVETARCTWFINEWWDFLWVVFDARRKEIIVLIGTATD